ncbi:MAG: hypothetical protein LBK47_03735 [Prevotellaceae bacterium]|jgi:hypothetical protein|nr:hypothetical protein [Prevotellaceae bacterium]
MKHILLLALLLSSFGFGAAAQVGVNTTTPDSTALLDIRYSGQGSSVGVLLPHLDAGARQQVKNRVSDGMLVFDRNEKQLYCYDGKKGEWVTATPLGAVRHENGFRDIRPQDAAVNELSMGLGLPADEAAKAKLDVGGSVLVRQNLKVRGSDTVAGSAVVEQNLQVGGNAIVRQSLQVTGSTTLQKSLTVNDSLVVNGKISAGSSTIAAEVVNATRGYGITPIGSITMWHGSVGSFDGTGKGLPGESVDGWAICNGANGTPDLRGRFIVGAIAGVQSSSAPTLASHINPSYQTDGSSNPNYRVGADETQDGNTPRGKWQHKLSVGEMPPHTHTFNNIKPAVAGQWKSDNSGRANICNDDNQGNQTSTAGLGNPHINLPPYYAVIFIMRIK